MSAYDLPLAELRAYRPDRTEPPDFDAFWADTLAGGRAAATDPIIERIATPLRAVTVDDVTFSGFGGQPIKAWLLAPAGATGPLPTIVEPRLRRRPLPPVQAPMGRRRVRPPRDGHPRPGGSGAPATRRISKGTSRPAAQLPGFVTRGRAARLVLPPADHRCRPRGGRRAPAPLVDGSRPRSPARAGRRAVARGRRLVATSGQPCPASVPATTARSGTDAFRTG
jgi:hypothetical protein